MKILHGYLFVTACGGLPGGYAEKTLHALAAEAADHKVNHVVVEANFGDGMFTELLKPVLAKIHPCQVEEVKHSRQKEARIIDGLASQKWRGIFTGGGSRSKRPSSKRDCEDNEQAERNDLAFRQ